MQIVLPAEWAPQSAVMLTWPHAQTAWQPWLDQIEATLCAMAREIAARERLIIVAQDDAHRAHVETLLASHQVKMDGVQIYLARCNDTWARDHGPITILEDGKPVIFDFGFNGWGNKFKADLDNLITRTIASQGAFGGASLRSFDFILEGGSIESDGRGTLLTTRRCLMSKQRNPEYSEAAIESFLRQHLGVKRILWLDNGYLAGDDTDSHIDTLARLCDPHTIAYVACDDPSDEHYTELRAMEKELQALRDGDGKPYRLVALPWPRACFSDDGERLPATYANFLIINGAVLVPTYNDPRDGEALAALKTCFPDRDIIGIDCRVVIRQYGSLHCLTMQIPSAIA